MTPLRYCSLVICGTLLLLLSVAAVNYSVDPAHIYTASNDASSTPAAYVKRLFKSANGLFYPANVWNEREIKREMAVRLGNSVDCAVIGSSRIMQVSSWRQPAVLQSSCKQLANLGVSGASLEDYLALSWNLLQSGNRPRKIVFGIDPWSLNFRREPNWIHYRADVEAINGLLTGSGPKAGAGPRDDAGSASLLLNLINIDYFKRSVVALAAKQNKSVRDAPAFDFRNGAEQQVMLPDGSIVYSAAYIKNSKVAAIKEIRNYKIVAGKWYDEQAIALLQKLIGHLRAQHIEVVFALIPYHPAVWSQKASDTITALQIVEKRIRQMASQLRIRVVGSYHPAIAGCTAEEFFDFMHPKDTCLLRFEQTTAIQNNPQPKSLAHALPDSETPINK